MDDFEVLEIAPIAIEKISHIATELGATAKRELCGRLGGELFIAAGFLSTGVAQPRKVRKLLKDVERICSWPRDPNNDYPCLRRIVQTEPFTNSHNAVREEIKLGLLAITEGNGTTAKDAISHIRNFSRRSAFMMSNAEEISVNKRTTPDEYPKEINALIYKVLRSHTNCTCVHRATDSSRDERHLVRLFLQPLPPANYEGNVPFDMLFSSTPPRSDSTFGYWQDVQFLVPRAPKKHKRRARFVDDDDAPADRKPPRGHVEVPPGQFCDLIRLEVNARLCLTIQSGNLHRFLDSVQRKQNVEHTPGISLSAILQNYHLTPKMKATLAYILAMSVWQFYDSDWMKTRWTSDTIQFMKEYSFSTNQGDGNVFTSKPYFAVRFDTDDADACESSIAAGEIHRYPRVRALGIMLVEIGIGSLLPRSDKEENLSQTAKANQGWVSARQYSDMEDPWPEFDYRKYRTAVKNCLDPQLFDAAPFLANSDESHLATGLRKRRQILYDCIVSPLEDFLQGTGWKDEMHTIGPLRPHAKTVRPNSIDDSFLVPQVPSNANSNIQKSSKRWLKKLQYLHSDLHESLPNSLPPGDRVRIAVLDTGYDPDAIFFQHRIRRQRLVRWKDWVESAEDPQDSHGHGTHLVSLIMKVAPEAEICVARVAKDPKDLTEASENVAAAIEWAQAECKADIISMSFGYIDDQRSISNAIRSAVNDRDESILFFAAAANSGANEREMFPARHECVTSVRGTNSNGAFQDFNPPRNSWETFAIGTLGLEVPASSLSGEAKDVYKSGTSVATAIAAGLAAMLLGYVSRNHTKSSYHTVRSRLKTRKGMTAMLQCIASDSLNDGYIYVAPWCLQDKSDDERWAMCEAAVSKVF